MTRGQRNTRERDEDRKHLSRTEGRTSRDTSDLGREDTGDTITAEEREMMLRDAYLQNRLPSPPPRPGVHWLWASTTNTDTPVSWYKKLGYRLVPAAELEEFADASMRSSNGEYSGCIVCNEMVLMKVSEEGYQQIMRSVHHDRPNQEDQRILANINGLKDAAGTDSAGKSLVVEEGDGFSDMERVARRPRAFD